MDDQKVDEGPKEKRKRVEQKPRKRWRWLIERLCCCSSQAKTKFRDNRSRGDCGNAVFRVYVRVIDANVRRKEYRYYGAIPLIALMDLLRPIFLSFFLFSPPSSLTRRSLLSSLSAFLQGSSPL